jgi:N-acyl-D-amino-acid deacylase
MVLLSACGGSADDASALPSPDPALGPWDLLIHGGSVVDGSGAPAFQADLLIRAGVIDFIGRVEPGSVEVAENFDATGLTLTPGFIDAHAHGNPLTDAGFQNFLAMGVTTILLGQDGGGPEAATLAAHMDQVDYARPGVNVAYLLGHNTLRRESGVGFGDPGSAGLARMTVLVERALDAGAFGISTGLEYDPGIRAAMEELVAVARPVAERGGVVMSHMRNEDQDQVEASLAELLEQGRRSGARVHASHLKIVLGSDTLQARRLLSALDEARAEGRGASADVYPYTASFTGLSILFPEWARPPNDYARVVAERRPELAEHLRGRVESRNGPGATLFGSGPWSGRTLEEAARETGRPYDEVLIDLGPAGASAAYFVMDEEVMATFLRDPWVAVSSDGSPTMRHPRGYGAFARIIRRFVVEEEMLTLEEAVEKMSGLTALIIGLDDPTRVETPRGEIRVGWAADLLAFRPDEVQDVADFEEPHRLAEGMRRVWVGGVTAWRDGAPVPGPGPGRVIRARHP